MTDLVEVTSQRPLPDTQYSPSGLRLYGKRGSYYKGRDFDIKIRVEVDTLYELALIYGYAYQGHCYTLPEPAFIVLPVAARQQLGANAPLGCGYDGLGYDLWIVDKLTSTVMLQFAADTIEQLVLNRNLPGGRQPMSYAGKWQMLHRGGTMSE